jgi:hypothetical protein
MVRQIVLTASLAASLAACTPSEPLVVTNIQTGTSLNSDDSVATHTTRFGPRDTMYVAVLTGDRGSGTIEARWSLGGRVIHEAKKDVSYLKPAATELRFQVGDAFPRGEYRVEVFVDGTSVGTRNLTVE